MNSKTILITGGNGMVGSQMDFACLPAGRAFKLDKEQLDILDPLSIQSAIEKYKPDTIVHLAAMTNMLECEQNPKRAYEVNVVGTKNIAEACRENNIKLVYLSTGAVFNGSNPHAESSTPNALNVYGKTKAEGEEEIKKMLENYIIVRTGWLFGGGATIDTRFVYTIFSQMKERKEIKAVSDRFGSPTYTKDLIAAIHQLIKENAQGTFHIVNSNPASYLEITEEIKKLGIFKSPIIAVTAAEFENSLLKRSVSEVLISSKINLRKWQDSLKEYIDTLQ